MLISKMLPRRTLLKALGATVGLPLLDAMIPAGRGPSRAFGRTAIAPRLAVSFIYFPHGAVGDQWIPSAAGAGLELPPILAPLAPFRDQLTVISGLENKAAAAPPVHAITPATWLSCATPQVAPQLRASLTVDQIMARKLGQDTPFASIQVATEVSGGEGSADRIYGSGYVKTISVGPSAPLPMEHDPRKLFQRLFGWPIGLPGRPMGQDHDGGGQSAPPRSVLDLIRADAAALHRKLGPRDRAVLADYLANVREVERRVHAFVPAEAPGGARESSSPTRFDEHMQLMFDLIALAYQANATRVTSFMMAAEVSDQQYDFIGVPDSFHALSHHGNSPAKLARLARIQAYNTSVFAKFVGKLATLPDGDGGSLLDHSLIVYGSNMGNSNLHGHSQLPVALLGGGCGRLRGNRHVRCPEHTPLANLHVALLNAAGIPTTAFADSTGELSL